MGEEHEWRFIASDGQEYGPFSWAQMQSYAADGTMTPETLVWTEGLEEWTPASTVQELFPSQPRQSSLLTGAVPQSSLASPTPAHFAAVVAAPVGSTSGVGQSLLGEAKVEVDMGFVTVAWGLRLIVWGFLINLLASLTTEVLTEVGSTLTDSGVFVLAMVVGFVMEVIGISMCFTAPRDSQARAFLAGALSCMLVPILLLFAGRFDLLLLALSLQAVSTMIVMLLMVLYVKRVAFLIGKRVLELSAKSLATHLAVFIGIVFSGVIVIAVMIAGAANSNAGGILGHLTKDLGPSLLLESVEDFRGNILNFAGQSREEHRGFHHLYAVDARRTGCRIDNFISSSVAAAKRQRHSNCNEGNHQRAVSHPCWLTGSSYPSSKFQPQPAGAWKHPLIQSP